MKKISVYLLILTVFFSVFSLPTKAEYLPEIIIIGGIEMVLVQEGSFYMGSKDFSPDTRPQHFVDIDSFYMSTTEVTQELYQSIMNENPSYNIGNPALPVENVSWYEAARFCNRLSDSAGFDCCYDEDTWACDFSQNGFRLPTIFRG